MTQEQILESNKLIAEFMGVENPYYKGHFTSPNGVATLPEDMKYHISWEWLMLVIDKIEGILPDDSLISITYKTCIIPVLDGGFDIEISDSTKIGATYKAVVQFIQWYNQQAS